MLIDNSLFQDHYYFGEHLRANWGFANPNIAALYLVTIYPVVRIIERLLTEVSKHKLVTLLIQGGVLALRAALAIMIAMTGCRGGYLALCAIICLELIVARVHVPRARKRMYCEAVLIASVLLADAIMSGQLGRVQPRYIRADKSISNRMELWEGSAMLCYYSPMRGWGVGRSGSMYCNWVQRPEHTEVYQSCVSSYLTIAAERGLPVLGAVTFGIAAVLLAIFCGPDPMQGRSRQWFDQMRLSVVAMAICGVFSTFTLGQWGIFIGLIVCCGAQFVISNSYTQRKTVRFVIPAVASIMIVSGIYGIGRQFARQYPFVLRRLANGTVRVKLAGTDGLKACYVAPDPAVLGVNPGKQLRDMLVHLGRMYCLEVGDTQQWAKAVDGSPGSKIMFFGKEAAAVMAMPRNTAASVYLIAPYGDADFPRLERSGLPTRCCVIVSGFRELRSMVRWEHLARELGLPVDVINGHGVDLEDALPFDFISTSRG